MKGKFLAVLLLSVSLMGCNYLEDKRTETMRAELKSTNIFEMGEQEQQLMAQMGMKLEMKNEYPNIIASIRFTTINKDEIPAADLQALSQGMEGAFCDGVAKFEEGTLDERKRLARIFKEDKVTMSIVMKDKIGREIFTGSEVIADCPTFRQLNGA
ncbi:MAG: hypothetical protein Q4G13_03040 [Moraxella sp.]|nr:hypothetical protein [Moraxella sp.]